MPSLDNEKIYCISPEGDECPWVGYKDECLYCNFEGIEGGFDYLNNKHFLCSIKLPEVLYINSIDAVSGGCPLAKSAVEYIYTHADSQRNKTMRDCRAMQRLGLHTNLKDFYTFIERLKNIDVDAKYAGEKLRSALENTQQTLNKLSKEL